MLTLSNVHKTTITIDDEPVQVHVKRMTKSQGVPFEREFFRFGSPRGDKEPTDEEKTAARQFVEESIIAYVTVPPGQIKDDDHDVTTGEDVIRVFCTRGDVLAAFYQSIYSQNFLGKAQKKILSGLPYLSPGSELLIQERNGGGPEPSATSVESSSTAPSADVTASSDETPEDARESSGPAVH